MATTVKLPTIIKGDAQVFRGARFGTGANAIKVPKGRLTPSLEGSVAVLYDVGPVVDGFRLPLTTRIDSVPAADTIITRDAPQADVATMSRVAVGPDHSLLFQNALDDLRTLGGGRLDLDGRYLVRGLNLSDASYSGIQLVGKSLQTTSLEQWDTAIVGGPSGKYRAVIALGYDAENPAQNPAKDWIRDVLIQNLTLRQLPTVLAVSALATFAARDVEIAWVRATGGAYELVALGGHSTSIYVHDLFIDNGGFGGPAEHQATSGLNVLAHDVRGERVRIVGCGQGAEISGHRTRLSSVTIERGSSTASPARGVSIGSAGQGVWDVELTDFTIRDYDSAIELANILGTANRLRILRPRIHNGSIILKSGLHFNDPSVAVLDVETDRAIHEGSFVIDPVITCSGDRPPAIPFSFGQRGKPWMGLESVTVINATVFLPMHQWCVRGDRDGAPAIADGDCPGGRAGIVSGIAALVDYGVPSRWQANTAYAFGVPVRPPVDNGCYYIALAAGLSAYPWRDVGVASAGTSGDSAPAFPTMRGAIVVDHGVTWLCMGLLPRVRFSRARIYGPDGGRDDPGAIRLDFGEQPTPRDALVFDDHMHNYDWQIVPGGGAPAIPVPANTSYSR